jgi:hypothetical protein
MLSDEPASPGETPLLVSLPAYALEQRYERGGRGLRVLRGAYLNRGGSGPVVLVAHPGGIPAELTDPRAFSLRPADSELATLLGVAANLDRSVAFALLEPFGAGTAAQPEGAGRAGGSQQFFTTFNRTDAAESVYDLLTVLGAKCGNAQAVRVSLVACGRMGPVSLLARAMVPDEVARGKSMRTVIDMNGFDVESDEAYLKELNIPHIRRIGGLRAVAAVACNGPIWFHNAGSTFDEGWVQAAGKVNGVEVRVTREKAEEKAIAEWLMK